MKYVYLLSFLLLTGCSSLYPVKQEFPVAPKVLLEKCPDLMIIDDGKNSLRDMLKVVIQNYATYYQCAEKTEGWQNWYTEQKKIFDGVK
jgi:hypothetical protein